MPEPGVCALCGAEVLWCRSWSGVLLVLDNMPDPKGCWIIVCGAASADASESSKCYGGDHYRNHVCKQ